MPKYVIRDYVFKDGKTQLTTTKEADAAVVPMVAPVGEGRMAPRPGSAVLTNADLWIATLKSAERDLQAFRLRYRGLEHVCEHSQVIAGLEDRIRRRREGTEREQRQAMLRNLSDSD
jgi:hypothetical protein